MAISGDGKISTRSFTPARFTSQQDTQRLGELRLGKDALLVGRGTLLADTMSLTAPGDTRQPLRCVVSRNRGIPSNHPLLNTEGGDIHLCNTERATAPKKGIIQHHGSLKKFLQKLEDDYGVKTLHCEGGGQLLKSLFQLDVINDLYLTLAGHTIFGGSNAPSLTGLLGPYLPNSRHFKLTQCSPTRDNECFLLYQKSLCIQK